jgi:hypothetical protein
MLAVYIVYRVNEGVCVYKLQVCSIVIIVRLLNLCRFFKKEDGQTNVSIKFVHIMCTNVASQEMLRCSSCIFTL